MSDRYKEMGLEMLPNKHYASWSDEPRPGLAMVYRTRDKVIPVICDEKRIFTCDDSTVDNDIVDWDAGNKLQGLIIDCADNDLTVAQALAVVREKWGQPDIELRVDDVNTAGPAIREALGIDAT
ncbi:hypothetical protein QP937_05850 [Corynebacterium pseudodiphtheriticum]|uniref:hypothetical protein n=1 Tax=Corynebacterium pseudodiphtheriticum TaxID=37637 RepID=UPI0025517649|nr:hypothetical protein [Corynebacterium pseudodiphtheriticum]MDK8479093.1 hypothetical protein [Corynebacterium pseudodiphtheriticum]MDK8486544.1 hypothetical protein [Corynebacterium pseudodiphtheriticum]MDK8493943.1 hypothetical protein [Corynebacterium pseudodiphtheriticum]